MPKEGLSQPPLIDTEEMLHPRGPPLGVIWGLPRPHKLGGSCLHAGRDGARSFPYPSPSQPFNFSAVAGGGEPGGQWGEPGEETGRTGERWGEPGGDGESQGARGRPGDAGCMLMLAGAGGDGKSRGSTASTAAAALSVPGRREGSGETR